MEGPHFQNMQLVNSPPQIHYLIQLALHLHGSPIQTRYTHMLTGHEVHAQLLYLTMAGRQSSGTGMNRSQIRLTT